jgi:hypothetical protein
MRINDYLELINSLTRLELRDFGLEGPTDLIDCGNGARFAMPFGAHKEKERKRQVKDVDFYDVSIPVVGHFSISRRLRTTSILVGWFSATSSSAEQVVSFICPVIALKTSLCSAISMGQLLKSGS